MKLNIFKTKIPSFGLQLNATTLKFMQLEPKGSKVQIKAYTHSDMPKGVISGDVITNVDALGEFLRTSLKKPTYGKLSTNHVSVTLPESKSFVRVIHIPQMNESEIDNAVLFEAEAYIPLPIDQVYCDWRVLGTKGGQLELLIIASPKDVVDTYVAAMEKTGLRVVAVEVESESIVRAIIPTTSTETTLVVDVDALKTNMIMVEHGNLQFTSSIPLGGNLFTQKLSEGLGITLQQADTIKKKVGIANTPEYPNVETALLPILKNLSAEIKNVLNFHSEHDGEEVSRIVLTGGTAKMKNLPELLAEDIKLVHDVPVQVGNPWQNIPKLASDTPLTEYEALSFTAAIGVAMRNLY